ncbi:hypothetical protein [uncultured Enterococcus sp.]|uniref:hypothetical protein n=1 Tax=uncultured Enterococcus sp. TaxID=167972 RepID=UPI0028EA3C38|nr:hypothetical protein [uncultured Enterococcus sp.]
MGRYSFFILSFCYRGNYVYADSSSSDVLLDTSSSINNSSSSSTSDSQTSTVDSSSSIQQEESSGTYNTQESSQENVSDSIETPIPNQDNEYDDLPQNTLQEEEFYSPYQNFFDMFGGSIDILYDDENTFYENVRMAARAMWTGTNFKSINVKGSDIGGGALGNITIGSAFSSWSWPAGTSQNVINHGILNAAKNSIYATNSRIDGLFDNFDSLNSRVNSVVSDLNSHKSWASSAIVGLRDRATSLEKHEVWASNAIADLRSTIDYINTKTNTINSDLSSHKSWATDAVVALRSRATDIDTKLVNHMSWAEDAVVKLRERATDIDTKLVKHMAWAEDAVVKLRERATDIDSKLVKHMSWAEDAVVKLRERATDIDTKFESHKTWATDSIVSLRKADTDLNTKIDNNATWATDSIVALRKADTDLTTKVDNHVTWATASVLALRNADTATNTKIDNHITWAKSDSTSHWTRMNTMDQQITSLQNEISGINWSDAGIIAAIIGLHDTWKSKDYNASILPDDGDAVKLMKSVANKIGSSVSTNISLLRDVFGKDGTYWVEYDKRWNNFPLWLQGLLNNYFDNIYNMENKDSLLYRLVYFFIDEMTKTRDFVIAINDNLLIANDSLLIIVDWLKMIYSKPPDIVNVSIPPFDFDRLQQILNGLNFGNIVNEAGTNIWDFLSQLIKTLGEIISTAITGLTDVVGEILDLLGDLINQIIKLIVPENLDFLDTGFGTVKSKIDIKFGSFLSLGNQVKEVVQPIDQDFKKVVSIDIMGAKFNPDFSTIDWVVVRFRTVMALSIWMSVAIYIYRKITGNGDLINDN